MTNADRWEQQPGGLYLAVSPFDKTNREHREVAESVVRDSVLKVAKVHGASFSEKGFRNNMRALYAGDIKLDLFLANWEICRRKAIYVGAALNWETVGINAHGKNRRAIYTEDVCLLTDKLRKLIRERPEGQDFPEESLAECFERISLQKMLDNGVAYRYGEVDRDNTKMVRSLNGNEALLGTGPDSAVLEFKSLPNPLVYLPEYPKAIPLRKDGIFDENNFIVRWHNGFYDVRFIVRKGQATAVGRARADVFPWPHSKLPPQYILEGVVASSLGVIKHQAEAVRQWGARPGQGIPSPNVREGAARSEIYVDLYQACGNELIINAEDRPSTFDFVIPDAHVFIIQNQRMLDAFVAVGAEPRLFGNKPMIPGVNILNDRTHLINAVQSLHFE